MLFPQAIAVASTYLMGSIVAGVAALPPPVTTIPGTDPNIYYHGRWDESTGSWWAGTGFKLNIRNLHMLTITLGEKTTLPHAAASISIDDSPSFTVNLTGGPAGNWIQLPAEQSRDTTLVSVNVEGWQNNRIQFESIMVNADATLIPYKPARLAFQFIGDSLSAGQFLPQGVNEAWPFLVAQHFKAEYRINAQPGATLTDMESYGNVHGISYQFFRTEDTGFFYTQDHNFTTAWDFKRDKPDATHVVLHVGANDASHNISNEDFVRTYSTFLDRLREIYPTQPIYVFTPWGWPHAGGNVDYYYEGQYPKIVDVRKTKGDKKIFLVDTTGWVAFGDVFPDNVHPNVAGHAKIAKNFIRWLKRRQ